MTPDGLEWRVSRRWSEGRPSWTLRRPRELASESLSGLGVPDFPGVDSAEGLLLVVLAMVLVLLLVPILFFGVELVAVGAVLAAGVVGRVVLRQPWTIEATAVGTERRLEWQVRGWRKSRAVIRSVVSDLAAGREPDPTGGDRPAIAA